MIMYSYLNILEASDPCQCDINEGRYDRRAVGQRTGFSIPSVVSTWSNEKSSCEVVVGFKL